MQKHRVMLILLICVSCLTAAAAAKDFSLIEQILRKVDEQSSFPDTDLSAVMTMTLRIPNRAWRRSWCGISAEMMRNASS